MKQLPFPDLDFNEPDEEVVDAYVDETEGRYLEFLFDKFDNTELRQEYVATFWSDFENFRSNHEEDV